jgi:hypothetical protein
VCLVISIVFVAGCSSKPSTAETAPASSNPPWTVVRTLSAVKGGEPVGKATFCLGHNTVGMPVADSSGYEYFDIDTGLRSLAFDFKKLLHTETNSTGLIVGEGKWSFAWSCEYDAPTVRRYFVSTSAKGRKVLKLTDDLPGLALQTVAMPDGSFLSIRIPDPNTMFTSVYELREGRATKLTANATTNPYWRWANTAIGKMDLGETTHSRPSELPDEAPTCFSPDGRALDYLSPTVVWEWTSGAGTWQPVKLPKGVPIQSAFYAGSMLFAQGADGSLSCRRLGGDWVACGQWTVLAKDGGRDLIVSNNSTIQIVKPE